MKKIAFVHVPKAAGGSIKRWLRKNISRENFVYTGHRSLEEYGVFEYDESFCVVRNTYDRLISLYTWTNSKLSRVIKKHSNAEDEVNLQRALALKEAHGRGMIPFFETYKELNWTTLSQLHFIKNVDHILKYERLNDDFMLIQKKLDCFVPLNKTEHVQPEYSKKQFYTSEFKEYVMKNFEEELDFFHYSLPEV